MSSISTLHIPKFSVKKFKSQDFAKPTHAAGICPYLFCFSSATIYVVRIYYCYVGWYKRINKHLKVCYKVVFHIYLVYQFVHGKYHIMGDGKCLFQHSTVWLGRQCKCKIPPFEELCGSDVKPVCKISTSSCWKWWAWSEPGSAATHQGSRIPQGTGQSHQVWSLLRLPWTKEWMKKEASSSGFYQVLLVIKSYLSLMSCTLTVLLPSAIERMNW